MSDEYENVKYCPLSFSNEQALEKCSRNCKWYVEQTDNCALIEIGEWMCKTVGEFFAEFLPQYGFWAEEIVKKFGQLGQWLISVFGKILEENEELRKKMQLFLEQEEKRRQAETERAISEEEVTKEREEVVDEIERINSERRKKRAMGILKDDCDAVEKQARVMGLRMLRTCEFSNLGRDKTERIYYLESDGVRTVIRKSGGEEEEARFPTLFDAVASMPWPVGEVASLRAEVWRRWREIKNGR